jgi:hypothetical protein
VSARGISADRDLIRRFGRILAKRNWRSLGSPACSTKREALHRYDNMNGAYFFIAIRRNESAANSEMYSIKICPERCDQIVCDLCVTPPRKGDLLRLILSWRRILLC